MERSHGLDSNLGDLWVIEESVPSLLHLSEGEPTGELDAKMDGREVVCLLDGTNQHEVVSGTPSPEVFGSR